MINQLWCYGETTGCPVSEVVLNDQEPRASSGIECPTGNTEGCAHVSVVGRGESEILLLPGQRGSGEQRPHNESDTRREYSMRSVLEPIGLLTEVESRNSGSRDGIRIQHCTSDGRDRVYTGAAEHTANLCLSQI